MEGVVAQVKEAFHMRNNVRSDRGQAVGRMLLGEFLVIAGSGLVAR
jgi:hypothetical protein